MATNTNRGRGRGRGRRSRDGYGGGHKNQGRGPKTNSSDVDESSNIIQAFRTFQQELDNRNDRHERIVKLSRDITIESKRLIFLLQRVAGTDDKAALLTEAAEKFQELHTAKFLALAEELDGQDPFQFLRAFSPGLQEYIEAVTFYHYLADNHLIGIDRIQPQLTFMVKKTSAGVPLTLGDIQVDSKITKDKTTDSAMAEAEIASPSNSQLQDQIKPSDDTDKSGLPSSEEEVSSTSDFQGASQISDSGEKERTVSLTIPPVEYMLGVADFTGELMRMAINSVGAGDLETPIVVAKMMRIIHDAFTSMGNTSREFRQKTRTLRQSLQKVETACYTLKVRGSEIPKHMLADVFSAPGDTFGVDEPEDLYS